MTQQMQMSHLVKEGEGERQLKFHTVGGRDENYGRVNKFHPAGMSCRSTVDNAGPIV